MSADNYYIIRKHPLGGFAAVMGFSSDDEEPEAQARHRKFDSFKAALKYACNEYSEYGVTVHEECVNRD